LEESLYLVIRRRSRKLGDPARRGIDDERLLLERGGDALDASDDDDDADDEDEDDDESESSDEDESESSDEEEESDLDESDEDFELSLDDES